MSVGPGSDVVWLGGEVKGGRDWVIGAGEVEGGAVGGDNGRVELDSEFVSELPSQDNITDPSPPIQPFVLSSLCY